MNHFLNECYSVKSTARAQIFGRGSAPGSFFSLYHSSERCFLSSPALEELLTCSLEPFVELVSLTLDERGRTVSPTGSYHLHAASLHFLAVSVSSTCCITDDDRGNKDEERRVG